MTTITETSSEYESKYASGMAHKNAGNQLFKDEEFAKALKEYYHALLYLRGLNANPMDLASAPRDPEKPTEEDVSDLDKDLSIIQTNMAACHLRLDRIDRVVACADAAHKANPFNKKAKFKLAQGYIRQGWIPKAEKLLDELEKDSPRDAAFAVERRLIASKEKEAEAKQRSEMRGMFDRANNKLAAAEAAAADETKAEEQPAVIRKKTT
ncbi:hypothetical protein IW146_004858 [Coemansia sp. RSA 922]|nr:hypothetical protein LPJ71_009690 [Coemansia sp. S17]KAJ2015423.1 hypothetical protein GGI14_004281 [Coemansia sp. S680]KAJ2083406.1 hypothetical protein GGI09_007380 [Coemansia sp. S100]KAJ2112106.1 hypothetical protein IW146_004858 [Coemansia sp. RSA 922]